MASIRQIQLALIAKGFPVGRAGADGVWGRDSIAAAKAFQRASFLVVDGIVGDKTLKALGLAPNSAAGPAAVYVWLEELRRRSGLHEIRDKNKLMAWLRSDKRTLGDPAKLPWCGDAMETAILLTLPDEPMMANPYWAKNWLNFGTPIIPTLGAMMVFGRPGGGGHIACYEGENSTHYLVRGGNQSNSIIVSPIAKNRFLGARWPKTFPRPERTIKVSMSNKGLVISTNEA